MAISKLSYLKIKRDAAHDLDSVRKQLLPVFAHRAISIAMLTFCLFACGGDDAEKANAPSERSTNTTVEPPNSEQPPINPTPTTMLVNAGDDIVVSELSLATLSGTARISNPPQGSEANDMAYAWTQLLGNTVTINNADQLIASFQAPPIAAETILSFQLTVTAQDGLTAEDTVTVIVTLNLPPIAEAGDPQVVSEQSRVQLNGTLSSDPDDDTLTYVWRQVSGPNAHFDDDTSVQPTFTAPIVARDTDLIFELSVTDILGNNDTDLITISVTAQPTGPIPPDPDGFLQFLNQSAERNQESDITATAYYAAVDPLNAKTNLDAWKSANGFDAGIQARAVYRNAADLGFGRVMSARLNADGSVAAYVENYLTLNEAVDNEIAGTRLGLLATVAMEYSAHPDDANGEKYVKFYTFGGNDQRILGIDLDGRGAKNQPGLCVVCHGGEPLALVNGEYPNRGNTGAQFLPWDVETFEFSEVPQFTRNAQAGSLKALNEIVLSSYASADAIVNGKWDGDAARELINGWYGGAARPANNFDETFVPPGWRSPAEGGPATNPADASSLYLEVVGPHCRACHSQRGEDYELSSAGEYIDFSTYDRFMAFKERTIELVYDEGTMPLALLTYQNFWSETAAGIVPAEVLGVHLGINALQRRPGRPIATAGPDRLIPVGNNRLSGNASVFAETYSWAFAPDGIPAGSQAVLLDAQSPIPTITADRVGAYRLTLTVSNGTTVSAPNSTTLLALPTVAPSNFTEDIQPIFLQDCRVCHSVGLPTSIENIPVRFDEPQNLLQAITPYINANDLLESPILTKPQGLTHGGGKRPGFDTTENTGSDRTAYETLVKWMAENSF